MPRDVPIIIGNKFFQLHKQLCDVIVVRKRGVEDGLNTESGKNPESANLAGTQSKRRDAKFRRETGDSGSATDAERDTHTRSQTPTGKAEGHQMHLPRVNEIAAEGKFRGNLSRKHTDADNARDGADARTDELMTASHDRKAQRDGTATYAHQTGERGDGQRVDNDINGTVSSRRRVTRNDIDKSTARDRQAESLINTTCQVVTRNATRAGARTDEVSKHDHRQRRERADRQSEERRIQDAIGKDDLDNTFKELSEIDMTDLEAVRKQKEHIATEFSKQQRSDPSLQIGWTRAERGSNEYKVIHGLLYKRTKFETDTVDDFALVVPQEHRKDLLIISHDTVSAGHLGINKTKDRLMNYFYWPGIKNDVTNYVKRCKACQLTAPVKTSERAPLQSMPILDAPPMSNITIDVMGPTMNKTVRGNRYLLVLVCNTTRYVQAYPLRNLKAATICDKLLHAFTMFGIPSKIFGDNMSSFRSELMTAVCEKFGVELCYSSVFHPISHGVIERTLKSLEDMIRKFLQTNQNDWDKLIDYLLFAMREAKHASTQFSPFEMLMGRKVSGPLTLQRQSWEQGSFAERELKTTSAAKYMQELIRKLQVINAAARENDRIAKHRMKQNYDRKSSNRTLHENDEVLLLLPSSNKKMEWKWQGPYKVKQVLQNNNYRINLGHRDGIYHINSLRKFLGEETQNDRPVMTVLTADDSEYADSFVQVPDTEAMAKIARETRRTIDENRRPTDTDGVMTTAGRERIGRRTELGAGKAITDTTERRETRPGDSADDKMLVNKKPRDGMVTSTDTNFAIGGNLTEQQRAEMLQLLAEFDDVFSEIPGKTNLITHKIRVTNDEPIWQTPYKIPDALRDKVEQELQNMLDAGIIRTIKKRGIAAR